ncbi:unnamed protein product [Prorocentrum cordatum]|uniref:Uncharacterized protein n=1 Tax=Prorocentrum cordatum TaxID=2364126 RepID=A0ABN9Y2G3_9DINO|nr:unnamed protein product [Polarella glacialis]
MVMGLRRSRELRHVMRQMQGMTKVYTSVARPSVAGTDEPRSPLHRRADRMLGDGSTEQPGREVAQRVHAATVPRQASEAHGLKEARRRELRQFHSISEGADRESKDMDFDAFVEFFREAGLLLEYGAGHNVTGGNKGDLLHDVVQGSLLGAEAPSGYGLQWPSSADSELTAVFGGQKEDGRVSALETTPPVSRLGFRDREDTPSEFSDWSERGDGGERGPSRIGAMARAGALQERPHSVAEAPGAAAAAQRASGPARPRSAALERSGGVSKRPGSVLERPESARMGSQASRLDTDERRIGGAAIMAEAALALGRMDVKRGPPVPPPARPRDL